jgi:3-deoxy-D-manno-octulosonate 8-phosphate phosphatase KdsC-like HAD superfamily phosphatase
VGLLLATADAAEPLRPRADLVLRRSGGDGAVRELAERLLKSPHPSGKRSSVRAGASAMNESQRNDAINLLRASR